MEEMRTKLQFSDTYRLYIVGADTIRPVKIKMILTIETEIIPFCVAKWAGG